MIVTKEELEKIKELAGLFFAYDEIAVLLDKDVKEFSLCLRNESTDAHKAYLSGKMESEYKLRKKTMERALKGSPAAEEMMMKHIVSQKIIEKQ